MRVTLHFPAQEVRWGYDKTRHFDQQQYHGTLTMSLVQRGYVNELDVKSFDDWKPTSSKVELVPSGSVRVDHDATWDDGLPELPCEIKFKCMVVADEGDRAFKAIGYMMYSMSCAEVDIDNIEWLEDAAVTPGTVDEWILS